MGSGFSLIYRSSQCNCYDRRKISSGDKKGSSKGDNIDSDEKNFGKVGEESFELTDFKILHSLGKGTYGNVELAIHLPTNKQVAIKSVRISAQENENSENYESPQLTCIANEEKVLSLCTGNQFAQYFGCFWSSALTVHFVMEPIVGKEFFYLWDSFRPLKEEAARFYLASVALALEKLHARNVIYKDLKLENLVLGADGYLRLVDFGFSKLISHSDELVKSDGYCGTIEYLAPEALSGHPYGKAVDIWSLGVLAYELLIGRSPFKGDDAFEIQKKIHEDALEFPESVSKLSIRFIEDLLQKDPTQRITIDKIKKHQFFSSLNFDDIENKEEKPPYSVNDILHSD